MYFFAHAFFSSSKETHEIVRLVLLSFNIILTMKQRYTLEEKTAILFHLYHIRLSVCNRTSDCCCCYE